MSYLFLTFAIALRARSTDILSRLRLYTCAAYIRKFSQNEEIRAVTTVRFCHLVQRLLSDISSISFLLQSIAPASAAGSRSSSLPLP